MKFLKNIIMTAIKKKGNPVAKKKIIKKVVFL
jgi:hypothetical protein